jgi:putative glycosyl hydrolase
VSRRLAVLLAAAAVGLLSATASTAARGMLVGIQDDALVLQGNTASTFTTLKSLRAQVVRINLVWGGKLGVATRRPRNGADPDDPAYAWGVYDRAVRYASQYGIRVLFSIFKTPSWAGGGRTGNRAPRNSSDLMRFAYAAATRYSGTFTPFDDDRPLPAVKLWLAWNEPNNPVWLSPQFKGRTVASAKAYARICDAIWTGVHYTNLAGEQVACGATGPRGNDLPRSSRPSTSPMKFIRALKAAGLKHLDAFAHHPYYSNPKQTPRSAGHGGNVQLGDIGTLISAVTKYWGRKPIWITEYGFQTNPPDRIFGISYSKQAAYLRQAYGIARANPRIKLMIWFLLRDDGSLSGWQSGLLTSSGKKKPSYRAFQRLPH